MCGENILVQWRYITANSCFPPGYKNTAVGQRLLELGWLRASGMGDCQYPYDPTGATGAGKPEQFWNCAEITIKCSNPTVSPAPTPPPQPTPQPKPTSSPTKAPVAAPGFGYCNYGGTHDASSKYFSAQHLHHVVFSNDFTQSLFYLVVRLYSMQERNVTGWSKVETGVMRISPNVKVRGGCNFLHRFLFTINKLVIVLSVTLSPVLSFSFLQIKIRTLQW